MLDQTPIRPFRDIGAPPPEHVILVDDLDRPAAARTGPGYGFLGQETHHRIKNGLQLVASMLNLQAREAGAVEAGEQLKEAARRVAAVASLHEHLQVADNERVDVSDLIVDICADLSRGAGCEQRGISFDLVLDDAELPGDRAGPLALILSELATNCLKHAYPRTGGKIAVRFENLRPGYRLSVADEGPGFAIAGSAVGGLGLSLVHQLARALRGRAVVAQLERGACIAIEFP
jgi:two-component sensor histidine kinase